MITDAVLTAARNGLRERENARQASIADLKAFIASVEMERLANADDSASDL